MIAGPLEDQGIGPAEGAIHYVAGELNHNGERRDDVIHLFGDGQQIIDITNAMTCKYRYLSSVLSFTKEESSRLTIEDVRTLAESFAEHLAHPFGTTNIAGCAYLHVQDGRYDAHLVQAQYDLESGKRVDLYLHSCGDTKRIAAWQDVMNHEYGLDDPRDPARQRLTKNHVREVASRAKVRSDINARIEKMHIEGKINSRADVCAALEALGYLIARKTKSSISITSPNLKKNMRLEGAIYLEAYAGITGCRKAIAASRRRSDDDRLKDYEAAKDRLNDANQRRTERLSKKLGIDLAARAQQPVAIGKTKTVQTEIGEKDEYIKHKITDHISAQDRDREHAEAMGRLSHCSRSLKRASERVDRSGDRNRHRSADTRRRFLEALRRVTEVVTRLGKRVTGTGGTAPR